MMLLQNKYKVRQHVLDSIKLNIMINIIIEDLVYFMIIRGNI